MAKGGWWPELDANARRNMRFEQVERFLNSGATVVDWCKLNGIPASTLYKWMAIYRKGELSEELGARQKSKATSEWVELSREAMKESVAITKKPEGDGLAQGTPENPILRQSDEKAQSQPVIRVFVNDTVIAIPPGADRRDITSVIILRKEL